MIEVLAGLMMVATAAGDVPVAEALQRTEARLLSLNGDEVVIRDQRLIPHGDALQAVMQEVAQAGALYATARAEWTTSTVLGVTSASLFAGYLALFFIGFSQGSAFNATLPIASVMLLGAVGTVIAAPIVGGLAHRHLLEAVAVFNRLTWLDELGRARSDPPPIPEQR